jgi:hypothetical protein
MADRIYTESPCVVTVGRSASSTRIRTKFGRRTAGGQELILSFSKIFISEDEEEEMRAH